MSEAEDSAGPLQNWERLLQQIQQEYETQPARGLAHGLQKDAIQNGWGARQKERGWAFRFALTSMNDGRLLLTMTDSGTFGLTGKADYRASVARGATDFSPDERLARFESMYFSGQNEGPGLFGRGKLLFSAASKERLIYYDSLTADGKYRLGQRLIEGARFRQPKTIEGDVARAGIKKWSANTLRPLEAPGTRITIVQPAEEVVAAIHDGTFLSAIEETWWEIIQKYDADITVASEDGKTAKAKIPSELGPLPQADGAGWKVQFKENLTEEVGGDAVRIKRIHILVAPSGRRLPEELRGVSIHRAGMKVLTDRPGWHASGV